MTDVRKLYLEILAKDELTPALSSANKGLNTFIKSSNNATKALNDLTQTAKLTATAMQNLNTEVNHFSSPSSLNDLNSVIMIMKELGSSLLLHSAAFVTLLKGGNELTGLLKKISTIFLVIGKEILTVSFALAGKSKQLVISTAAWIKNKAALAGNWLTATASRISLLTLAVMNNARAALVSAASWTKNILAIGVTAVFTTASAVLTILTGALYKGAIASWAFLAPWLPIIAAIGAVIAAGYLLWDIFNNGWDNSVLGKTLNTLKDILLPGVTAAWDGLTFAVAGFIDWVRKVPEWINSVWTSITNHPLWSLLETILRFSNPVGIGITAAQTLTGQYDPTAAFGRIAGISTQNITVSPVIYSSTEINGTNLSQKEIEEMMERNNAKVQRNLGQELNRGLISYL